MSSDLVSGFCEPRFQKVRDLFTQSVESGYEVGATLAVEYRGEMVINLWGGYQDAAKTRLWQEDTLVNVFSVTKGIVATCIARLVEEKRLDIYQPVSNYWPEYGCNGKENTTVYDLLCHRAAMFGFREPVPEGQWQNWSLFTELLAKQAPYRSPGESQSYHALTFGWLAGELIRRIDGRSVGQYFKDEIADPLALDFKIGLALSDLDRCADMLMMTKDNTQSLFSILTHVPDILLPKALRTMKAALEVGDNKIAFASVLEAADTVNSQAWRLAEVPAANGHGTAASLATFYGVLTNGGARDNYHILKPETLAMATQIHSPGPDGSLFGLPYKFGLGYMVDSPMTAISHAKGRFGHSGIGGEMTFGDKQKGLGFAFLNNQQHGMTNLYKTANQLSSALYKLL